MSADTGKPDKPGTGRYQVPQDSPLHAFIAEAMYDHGRWERPGPPPPALEWTVWSSARHHPRPLCIDGHAYHRRQRARRGRKR